MKLNSSQQDYAASIAVVGKSGKFPGTRNLREFWENLCAGKESIAFFTDEELLAEGVDPDLLRQPNFVKALGYLEDADLFDAQFFGFTPHEAQILDPQQRVFLECAWEALEDAGYASDEPGMIGVFASSSMSRYMQNLWFNPVILRSTDGLQLLTGNDKDHVAMRVSYKLNLTGPSVCVQSACSSSLVAVHLACRSLLTYECDMALAGGVSIGVPFKNGYVYQEGGIVSPDGHCRAFDAKANGTVIGYGAGVVVLKRLFEAIADGDNIQAVIRGSAINNDGSHKVGYTAPSVDSQASVIRSALAVARVPSDTITYVEAHGTGTILGDPIELTALTKAFRSGANRKSRCAVGALKTNIGHLDAAAGIAGLIKAVLALEHRLLPPSLNFEAPNPKAGFENSPFYVNTRLSEWNSDGTPRRAGVSSLGMGGTNVHLVLEEALEAESAKCHRKHHLLVFSAKTPSALKSSTVRIAEHLEAFPDLRLSDVARTLQAGRKAFSYRRAVVCESVAEAVRKISDSSGGETATGNAEMRGRPVVFMFPGQGSQYPGMGAGLYRAEQVFREHADKCLELLQQAGMDLKPLLYPDRPFTDADALQLAQTQLTQPALFITEYALAKLWMHWGIAPDAMIGHSIGEYVAACLSGVMSLEDALGIVVKRGALMQQTKPGKMLAVSCSAQQVEALANGDLSIAAINTPSTCVVSGDIEKIAVLEAVLAKENISFQQLVTSHAFHSGMMNPVLGQFQREIAKAKLGAPGIPYISNLTGGWATEETAMAPESWAQHLRNTVRFADGIRTLSSEERVYLEVGPGRSLSSFVKLCCPDKPAPFVLTSLTRQAAGDQESRLLLEVLGRLWTAGVSVDWSRQYHKTEAQRISLPTYPFERQRYFVAPDVSAAQRLGQPQRSASGRHYIPSWKQLVHESWTAQDRSRKASCVVFVDGSQLAAAFVQKKKESGSPTITVEPAPGVVFERRAEQDIRLDPINPDHYQKLASIVGDLEDCDFVSFWSMHRSPHQAGHISVEDAFHHLLFLAQVIGEKNTVKKTNIWVISNGVAQLGREDILERDKAILLGPCRTIPLEYENVRCCLVDVGFEPNVEMLDSVCDMPPRASLVACRIGRNWVQCFEPVSLPPVHKKALHLREDGVYLITGGLGGIGLALAQWLSREVNARLVLLSRSLPPARTEWDELEGRESTPASVLHQISVLRDLEQLENAPLICQGDVSEESDVRRVLQQTIAKFGAIHGIIHAGGVPGGGLIQFKMPSSVQAVLRPKIEGVLVLERVFQDVDLDFFVVCSSLSSVQGSFGQVDYCAANAFLDAFCLSNSFKPSTATFSIGWDAWKEVGMARNASLGAGLEHLRMERLSTALSTRDGIDAFARILNLEKTRMHVLVSNEDLTAVPPQASLSLQPHNQAPLSAPMHPRPDVKGVLVLPRNEFERSIAEVWQSVLGIEAIGIQDDFWELGGHSLLATQAISRLKEKFHIPLPLRALFEIPTIEKLAEEIVRLQDLSGHLQSESQSDFEAPIRPVDRQGKLVLSYGQERLWFIDQLEPGNVAYNIHTAVRIRGPLDVKALERTLREIVRRHESLRTRFVNVDGEPRQVIDAGVVVELPVLNLGGLEEAQREAEARTIAFNEARQPFDLQDGPLFRAKLLRLAGENHVLVFNMHHIVSDQWSIGILVREVSLIYNSFSAGQPSPLPELDIQYVDFSDWQRRWLTGEVLEKQLNYWKKQLAEISVLDLPTDYVRSLEQRQKSEVREFNLSADLTAKLKQLSLKHGSTLYMTLLAAFQLLLHRWSGQHDIAVGSPIAGRRRTEIETLIGFFLNTQVLRTDISGSPTFVQLLKRVREITLEAYAHQDVPFEKLVEELSPQRDLSRSPFFQITFFMQNAPMTDLYLGEKTTVELFAADAAAAKFDITVVLEEAGNGLLGSVQYRADLYDAATIAQLSDQYMTLLDNVTANPEQGTGFYSLVPQSVYQQSLEHWNQPLERQRALAAHVASHEGTRIASQTPEETHSSRPPFVHEMFERIAKQHPASLAIAGPDGDLTYAQLDYRSSRIAATLRNAGVRRSDLVVVCAENRKFIIECVLGILKAGAAFVPLSPGLPDRRLEELLAECAPRWALVAPETDGRFHSIAARHSIEIIASAAEDLEFHLVRVPGEESHGDDLGYIFFTSGSTGKPKAIAGRLKAIDHFIRWEIDTFSIAPGARVSQLMSPMFDAFMRDIFTPLCSAGTVCIPPVMLDGKQLGKWIQQERITLVHTVPSLFRLIINQADREDDWTNLQYMLLSGEPLLPSDVRKWHELIGSNGARLVNLYGPSETTMIKFAYTVKETDWSKRVISIGKPMIGTTAIAVDQVGRICAPGTVGELYIRTPFQSLGYLNRPALTAEVFVRNPFSPDTGDLIYKTGDLARPRVDGNFELVGRRDLQVKIRGVRIELGEIEKAVSECPGVGQALVTAREDVPGEKRLVAYVVPDEKVQLNAGRLRHFLNQQLPDYMVPSAWVILEKMPLTSSGKIDRKNLPQPDIATPEQDYVAPQSPMEETLCHLWQEVLRRERVGTHDNFFVIGGHSLLAAQVVTRMRESFKVDIPLRRIFESPTIAQLAHEINHAMQVAGANGAQSHLLPRIKRVQRKAAALPVEQAD